jgi:hypothetical protein
MGSQLNLFFVLADETVVLFKPKRQPRHLETDENLQPFYDVERHTAEISAFHLDRILGFRRVPPSTGRIINLAKDLRRLGSAPVTGQMFISRAGNTCFIGKCNSTCTTTHPVCGDGEQLEGSVTGFVPLGVTKQIVNPWNWICYLANSSLCQFSVWQQIVKPRLNPNNTDYCRRTVRQTWPFNNDSAFLHVVDAHIFDFLTGNMDRHHYDMLSSLGNDSFFILFDNGKGFRSSREDEMSLLLPLIQCCLVRLSTVERFLSFQDSPGGNALRLSDLLRRSLATEQLADPVLTEAHLAAVDRRVAIVLDEVYRCMQRSTHRVIIDDGL